MALVEVKEVLRVGAPLMQKVGRFISPPNPSGSSSFLWKSDSFSMQRRTLLMARMIEYKTSLFSSTQVSTPPAGSAFHTSSVQYTEAEPEVSSSDVTSAGTSKSETDTELLDRSYGQEQGDHHKVAETVHDHHMSTKDDEEPETLESTGFDMSKMTRPTGDE